MTRANGATEAPLASHKRGVASVGRPSKARAHAPSLAGDRGDVAVVVVALAES